MSRANPLEEAVRLHFGPTLLPGLLLTPVSAVGAVIFAHGSGSSHHSPRNIQVARTLAHNGIISLLFDLLTFQEAEDRRKVFNIPLLSHRLILASGWLHGRLQERRTRDGRPPPLLPFGYFGASTGAAAALWASTEPDNEITAIVSRGGRPDLAEVRLESFQIPVLLIVGGADRAVLEMTKPLMSRMVRSELAVVPGATHLFEEPGALESVTDLACRWFLHAFHQSEAEKTA